MDQGADCLYVEMQIELKCEYKSLTMTEKMGFEVYGIICEILASCSPLFIWQGYV